MVRVDVLRDRADQIIDVVEGAAFQRVLAQVAEAACVSLPAPNQPLPTTSGLTCLMPPETLIASKGTLGARCND